MFLCVDVKSSERPSLRFLFENLLKKEKKRRLSAQNFCSQKSTFCLQAGSMVWTRRVFKKNLSLQNKVNCESKKNFFFFEKWNQFRVLRIDHLECETTTKMFASLSNKQNNTTLPTFQDLWAQKELLGVVSFKKLSFERKKGFLTTPFKTFERKKRFWLLFLSKNFVWAQKKGSLTTLVAQPKSLSSLPKIKTGKPSKVKCSSKFERKCVHSCVLSKNKTGKLLVSVWA